MNKTLNIKDIYKQPMDVNVCLHCNILAVQQRYLEIVNSWMDDEITNHQFYSRVHSYETLLQIPILLEHHDWVTFLNPVLKQKVSCHHG